MTAHRGLCLVFGWYGNGYLGKQVSGKVKDEASFLQRLCVSRKSRFELTAIPSIILITPSSARTQRIRIAYPRALIEHVSVEDLSDREKAIAESFLPIRYRLRPEPNKRVSEGERWLSDENLAALVLEERPTLVLIPRSALHGSLGVGNIPTIYVARAEGGWFRCSRLQGENATEKNEGFDCLLEAPNYPPKKKKKILCGKKPEHPAVVIARTA
ncbi:uncharacterized protein MYCFIDRAFT_179829 [Pseudocercospora fijiensis CIRAD86]|uniref:Uncharacterized protein n=1 Tax=Pseudocercospora fijiensis (strain CIRAD86) TaxID=383855 RepID=M2ZYR3_PSEFD|nr:uncharacterized protein MYCFIDRAFT_179829 [Pseudocercospora fijiensis CIRAD86]EME77246.1 hypothetical protein MYCFIDRAFT_179829 [Pseudocercospora fijiensis CIRAD86]